MSSVKPFGYLCSVFLITSYIIGLWFSLRTHAAQIWETPLHGQDYPLQRSSISTTNWRDNHPDELIVKRIAGRVSSLFLRGEQPSADRADRGQSGKDIPFNSEGRLLSQSANFVQNADVATAAATVTVSNPQSPNVTSQAVPPPVSMVGPSSKFEHPQTAETRYRSHDWEHRDADLTEGRVVEGHDAPNWSRTKSSMILLGATILYAIIAGLSLSDCVK